MCTSRVEDLALVAALDDPNLVKSRANARRAAGHGDEPIMDIPFFESRERGSGPGDSTPLRRLNYEVKQ